MEKLTKKPIIIPEDVLIEKKDNSLLIKGPKGETERKIPEGVVLDIKGGKITISLKEKSKKKEQKKLKSLGGLYYKLLKNDIFGVKEGYEKKLEIKGIGYTASLDNEKNLILKIGFSHPVVVKKQEGVEYFVEKNIISVKGPDKERVGNVAAMIRRIKPPEPYKGKGIRYLDEEVRKKQGKKAVAAK